jgi:hypothetical protein
MASGIHAGAARLTGVQSRAIDTEDSSSGSRTSSEVERYRVWLLHFYQSTLPGNIIRSKQPCHSYVHTDGGAPPAFKRVNYRVGSVYLPLAASIGSSSCSRARATRLDLGPSIVCMPSARNACSQHNSSRCHWWQSAVSLGTCTLPSLSA